MPKCFCFCLWWEGGLFGWVFFPLHFEEVVFVLVDLMANILCTSLDSVSTRHWGVGLVKCLYMNLCSHIFVV